MKLSNLDSFVRKVSNKREPMWINPKDAEKLGIQNNDVVMVHNKRGKFLAGVVTTDRMRENVICVHEGAWYNPDKPGEIGAMCKHGNVNLVTSDKSTSKLAQGNIANTVLVKVSKYTKPLERVTAFDIPVGGYRMINKIILIFVFLSLSYAKGDAIYVSSPSNIYIGKSHIKAVGMLDIGAKVWIINKKNQWRKIKIRRWQQSGLTSVIYAFNGMRIIKAELTPAGEKFMKILKTTKNKNTDLIWKKIELNNIWIKYAKLSKNMNKTWKAASSIFSERCSMCHALPKSTKFTANQWPPTLKVMAERAALDRKQKDLVSKFLQYHAKSIAK